MAARLARVCCQAQAAGRRAFATAAAPAAAPYHGTFDYRRLRQRSEWRVPQPADQDFIVFGDEGLGQTPEVNWSLNRLKVTPIGEAYRNLHLRGLRMLTPSVRDASGSIVVNKTDAAAHKVFVTLPDVAPPKEGETAPKLSVPTGARSVSGTQAAQALRDLREHLSSEVERLFVHDGTINSGAPEVLLRAVTDDAATAVLLRNTILPAHLGHPLTFASNLTSFLSYSLPKSALLGADANASFSLLNLATSTLVMGGHFTSNQVLDSLAALANYQAASSGTGIPLPKCHSALTSSGVFLVLGASQPVIYSQLFGAHNNVWSKDGIARSFGGAIVSPPAAKYAFKPTDLVEKAGSSTRLVSSHTPERGYFAPHPSRIAFVVADKSLPAGNLFSASAKQAVALYKRLVLDNVPGVDADKLANDFGALLEVSSAQVTVINGNDAKEVPAAVAAATSAAASPKLDAKLFSS